MNHFRKAAALVLAASALSLSACGVSEADTTSENLSKDAEQFKVERRVVFFNGITDTYLLEIQGRCSIAPESGALGVTCKIGDKAYKKHFLGLSDNVSYFVEQVEPSDVDPYRYKVIFRPEVIIPDIDLETSTDIEGDG